MTTTLSVAAGERNASGSVGEVGIYLNVMHGATHKEEYVGSTSRVYLFYGISCNFCHLQQFFLC